VGFLRVLERMGVVFDVHNEASRGGETAGDVVVNASPLVATTVRPAEIPALIDEIPMLAALATRAVGVTEIRGAEELRAKESDRIATMVQNLRGLGADAEELPDGMVIRGPTPVRAGPVVTHGDHRIAMSFAILGVLAGVDLTIDQPGVVDVSYPTFWHDLARVTA
jgi:3-phosphoshikimate 1-carboxyvinyltransferase